MGKGRREERGEGGTDRSAVFLCQCGLVISYNTFGRGGFYLICKTWELAAEAGSCVQGRKLAAAHTAHVYVHIAPNRAAYQRTGRQ